MSRCTLRSIFTVLIYAGVGVFFFPYISGHHGHTATYLMVGLTAAVVFGILRACFMEGDCSDPEKSIHDYQPDCAEEHPHAHSNV